MQDKQKQIEEMAKVIMGAVPVTIQYVQAPANETEARIEAKALIAAGYRKQRETAREILDEVSRHYGGAWLVELYKKYGVEVEE